MKKMKKLAIYTLMTSLVALTACFDDDSTLPSSEEDYLNTIEIADMESLSAISCSTVLEIDPEVSGYSDDELSYGWYVYGGNLEYNGDFREYQIGAEKHLSYEVTLDAGTYTLALEVVHTSTGYGAVATTTLNVTTSFSEGFYIVKETADGNTDLDIYNVNEGSLMENVIKGKMGESLSGTPCYLDVVFSKNYTDPNTADALTGVLASVTTNNKEFACFNTTDMEVVFDRSSILFADMDADEAPLRMAQDCFYFYFFTDKSVRCGGYGDTGKFGNPSDDTAVGSIYLQAGGGQGLMYWDPSAHRVMWMYGPDYPYEITYYGTDVDFDELECISTGWNLMSDTHTFWFLLEDKSGQRYLAYADPNWYEITDLVAVAPSTHLAKSDLIATNAMTSYCLYAVDNNQLYSYSLDTSNATEAGPFTISGLGSDEEITFIADSFFNNDLFSGDSSNDYNYFVIGTRSGSSYKLYFYNIRGGQPYGDPVYTVEGEGTVRGVRFVMQTSFDFSFNMYTFYYPSYYSPNAPYTY